MRSTCGVIVVDGPVSGKHVGHEKIHNLKYILCTIGRTGLKVNGPCLNTCHKMSFKSLDFINCVDSSNLFVTRYTLASSPVRVFTIPVTPNFVCNT